MHSKSTKLCDLNTEGAKTFSLVGGVRVCVCGGEAEASAVASTCPTALVTPSGRGRRVPTPAREPEMRALCPHHRVSRAVVAHFLVQMVCMCACSIRSCDPARYLRVRGLIYPILFLRGQPLRMSPDDAALPQSCLFLLACCHTKSVQL